MNHCERSRIYISDPRQLKNKTLKILGAVCITIIEGDKLELTNLQTLYDQFTTTRCNIEFA